MDSDDNLWNLHLNFNERGEEINVENYACDVCAENMVDVGSSDSWYKFGPSQLDMCRKCHDGDALFEKNLKLIDRTKFSEEEKPRLWICFGCGTRLGGGCRWYCNQYINVDVCEDCRRDRRISDDFISVFEPNSVGVYYSERSGMLALDVFHEVSTADGYEVPRQILDHISGGGTDFNITREWNGMFLDLFESFVHCDVEGSLLNWTLCTEVSDMETFHACTGLAVNCKRGSGHPVASIVFDDHGRVSMDVIYGDFESFWKDYEDWCENKRIKDEKKRKAKIEEVKHIMDTKYSCDNIIMAEASDHFGEYIRLIRNLDFYYG